MSEQHLFAAADYVTRMLMVNQISYTLIVGGVLSVCVGAAGVHMTLILPSDVI